MVESLVSDISAWVDPPSLDGSFVVAAELFELSLSVDTVELAVPPELSSEDVSDGVELSLGVEVACEAFGS